MEEYTEYKIVVCGPGGVGKSCLTNQLIAGLFTEEYDPTIEDSYRKQVCVDGEDGVLDILDTAGQEEYSSMLDEYLRKGQGFLCVYSVTSRDSFEEIEVFRKKMLRATDRTSVPLMLVGNKIDLTDKRVVSTEEGAALAQQIGAVFIEASAKNNVNVEEAFYELVREIRRDRDAKGYQLPTGAAPDAEMEKKINNKFSRWRNMKEMAKDRFKKLFGRKGSKAPSPTPANDTAHTQSTQAQPTSTNNNNMNTNNGGMNNSGMNNGTTNAGGMNQSGGGQPASGAQSDAERERQLLLQQLEAQKLEQERRELELRQQQEALENQRLELERQRAGVGSTAGSPGPTMSPMAAAAADTGGDDVYGNFPKNLSDLEQPWFHGNLSSPEADELLLRNPRTGTFLIRFSSQPGHFAVSFIGDDATVQKALIQNDPEKGFCFVEPDAPYFPSLTELVLASDHVLQYPLPNPAFEEQGQNVADNVYGSLAEVQRRVLEEEAEWTNMAQIQ